MHTAHIDRAWFTADFLARFHAKTAPTESGCHEWTAATSAAGYGLFGVPVGMRRAHRIAYCIAHPEGIPDGLVIDHLCRNRKCVNPEHLEAVSDAENVARGHAPTAVKHAVRVETGLCSNGHPLTERSGRLICKECERLRWRELYADPEKVARRKEMRRRNRR